MISTKTTISIIYKVLMIIIGLFGIIASLWEKSRLIEMLSYYTIQSNIIVAVYLVVYVIALLLNKEVNRPIFYLFKGMATSGILLTSIVYHFTLRSIVNDSMIGYELSSIGNIVNHYIVPAMFFLDWIIFTFPQKAKLTYPIIWTVQPIGYLIYIIIYVGLGGRYSIYGLNSELFPYFFLNYQTLGIQIVLVWILTMLIGYLLIGYVLLGTHRFKAKLIEYIEIRKMQSF